MIIRECTTKDRALESRPKVSEKLSVLPFPSPSMGGEPRSSLVGELSVLSWRIKRA